MKLLLHVADLLRLPFQSTKCPIDLMYIWFLFFRFLSDECYCFSFYFLLQLVPILDIFRNKSTLCRLKNPFWYPFMKPYLFFRIFRKSLLYHFWYINLHERKIKWNNSNKLLLSTSQIDSFRCLQIPFVRWCVCFVKIPQ